MCTVFLYNRYCHIKLIINARENYSMFLLTYRDNLLFIPQKRLVSFSLQKPRSPETENRLFIFKMRLT